MSQPTNQRIFVFGSNLAGRHGAGSALHAKRTFGAIQGKGWGRQGNSYGIPTKGHQLERLGLDTIREYVDAFIIYAKDNPDLEFHIVCIGCGLAGYKPMEIAPMFLRAPPNCNFQGEFKPILEKLGRSHRQK